MIKIISLISLFFYSYAARSEYRAYQYLVQVRDPAAVTTKANPQYITSTLNPQMYARYYGGNSIRAELLRTWICPGYSGRNPICEHPYDKNVGGIP